jgi:hypothetical protein
MRFGSGVLVGVGHPMNRNLCAPVHFIKHSVDGIILKEWNLVFVAENPEFDQNRPVEVGPGRVNLILGKALSVEPDLESLKDINIRIR